MIELGRYSVAVLSAYGVSVLLLAGIIVQTLLANRRARRALDRQEKRRG